MNRLSAQTQMILAIAVVLVLAAAFVVLGIVPKFQESAALDDRIVQAQVDLQSAKTLVQRRLAAKAESAANQVELMKLANRVPDSPQLPTVIIQLQDAANAAGLEFAQISPQSVEPGEEVAAGQEPAFSKVPISVVVRGDWADIIEFTRKLDAMERAIRITSTNFKNVAATEEEDRYVEANITLEIYVMSAPPVNATSTSTNSQSASPPTGAAPSQ
jgi:Tfp pilus assembly protein PilO